MWASVRSDGVRTAMPSAMVLRLSRTARRRASSERRAPSARGGGERAPGGWVAGGRGAPPAARRQTGDAVVGAPDLERAGPLPVFGLEQHRPSGQAGERLGGGHRRRADDRLDALARFL